MDFKEMWKTGTISLILQGTAKWAKGFYHKTTLPQVYQLALEVM